MESRASVTQQENQTPRLVARKLSDENLLIANTASPRIAVEYTSPAGNPERNSIDYTTGGYTPVNTLIAFSIAAVSSSVIVSPLKR